MGLMRVYVCVCVCVIQKKARGKARWKTDKTPEELLAAQQALFAKARNRTAQNSAADSSNNA